jgi:hypothetical protein
VNESFVGCDWESSQIAREKNLRRRSKYKRISRTIMAAVDVYRATPSATGAHEVPENDTEELQLSQEEMDVASLSANTGPPPVIPSSVASTINSAPAYVSTTAGGERNQPHQVQVVDGSSGGGTESGVLITEPVLGVRMLMSSRVSGVCVCVCVCERERERESESE